MTFVKVAAFIERSGVMLGMSIENVQKLLVQKPPENSNLSKNSRIRYKLDSTNPPFQEFQSIR
jgi:hypothetical protein